MYFGRLRDCWGPLHQSCVALFLGYYLYRNSEISAREAQHMTSIGAQDGQCSLSALGFLCACPSGGTLSQQQHKVYIWGAQSHTNTTSCWNSYRRTRTCTYMATRIIPEVPLRMFDSLSIDSSPSHSYRIYENVVDSSR